MRFFSRMLEGEGSHKEILPPPLARGLALNQVAYDPELVSKLKDEHQELLRLFTLIKAAAAERRFHKLPSLLYRLEVIFHQHITLENARFYGHVKQACAADHIESRFVATVHSEMDDIAYQVDRFVNKHLVNLPTAETVRQFHEELDRIASLLIWRLQFEERSLFYLYQP